MSARMLTTFNAGFILTTYAWTGHLVGYGNMFRILGWFALGFGSLGIIVAVVAGCIYARHAYKGVASLANCQLRGIGH